MEKNKHQLRQLIRLPFIAYRLFLRPLINPYGCCCFYPSCSSYAVTAIQHYGLIKGSLLTCYRLLRCNPWVKGGFDPVIPNQEKF